MNVLNENETLNITAIHEACKSESLSKRKASCVRHNGGNPDVGFDHVEWRTVLVKL